MDKALFIRMDGIGDLISTMPADRAPFLDPERGTDKGVPKDIVWIIAEGLDFIPLNAYPSREYFSVSKKWQNGWKKLSYILKSEKPERVVIFYAPWWVYFCVLFSGIKNRIGRLSQWYSFICLNKGLRQSRIESLKHEMEYNWDLVHFAYDKKVFVEPGILSLLEHPQQSAVSLLYEKWNIAQENYIVIHPGMAGSALNWPIAQYDQLIERVLSETQFIVFITGSSVDMDFIQTLKQKWEYHQKVRYSVGRLSTDDLLIILKKAFAILAPSTGIAHLGASLGTKTIGIYCPIKSMHPKRWGIRGDKTQIVTPNVPCPAMTECLGQKCPHFDCMKSITVDQVFTLLVKNQTKAN
jgi:heptosyltransferase I